MIAITICPNLRTFVLAIGAHGAPEGCEDANGFHRISRPASEPAPAAHRAATTALRHLVAHDMPPGKATRAQARPGGNLFS